MTSVVSLPQTISLDRRNPNLGYIKENVVLCCWIVNHMKQDYSIEEFKRWSIKITNYDFPLE